MRTKVLLAVLLLGVLVLTPVLAYEACVSSDTRSCDHTECCMTRYVSCDLFNSKGPVHGYDQLERRPRLRAHLELT
jgi:hypothetical protein